MGRQAALDEQIAHMNSRNNMNVVRPEDVGVVSQKES